MDILYFSGQEQGIGSDKVILRNLTTMSQGNIYPIDTTEDVKKRLIRENDPHMLAILIASDIEVLMDLYHLSHLFYKASTILVLPDNEKDTIALGRRMKPNFLLPKETNVKDILSISRRMLSTPPKISVINSRATGTIKALLPDTSPVVTTKISNL